MKKFLGLPVLESAGWQAVLKHVLSIILFTALGYFLISIITGITKGDTWKYIQQVDKDYFIQFILLFSGVIIGILIKGLLNMWKPFFFHLPKLDRWLYPLGFIITYMIINEIAGF